MATNSLKHLRVEDFKTLYTTKEYVAAFCKSINLSTSGDEEDVILKPYFDEENVILKPYFEEELINMVALRDDKQACPPHLDPPRKSLQKNGTGRGGHI